MFTLFLYNFRYENFLSWYMFIFDRVILKILKYGMLILHCFYYDINSIFLNMNPCSPMRPIFKLILAISWMTFVTEVSHEARCCVRSTFYMCIHSYIHVYVHIHTINYCLPIFKTVTLSYIYVSFYVNTIKASCRHMLCGMPDYGRSYRCNRL